LALLALVTLVIKSLVDWHLAAQSVLKEPQTSI
jgi:hypothetical protein